MTRFLKPIAIALTISILFQSCAVYEHNSVSPEEAAKTKKRVLMITPDGKKVKLKRVIQTDSTYIGILSSPRNHKITLDNKKFKELRPLDTNKTTLGNIGIAFLGAVVIAAGIIAATYDPFTGFEGFGDGN